MSLNGPSKENREIPAFPPWLDLPPGYIVNDWIHWQKGKLVARRLRDSPDLVLVAKGRLNGRLDRLCRAEIEWLEILNSCDVEEIAGIMESSDHEGQRLRSSAPFNRVPFVNPEEIEAIRERAYFG